MPVYHYVGTKNVFWHPIDWKIQSKPPMGLPMQSHVNMVERDQAEITFFKKIGWAGPLPSFESHGPNGQWIPLDALQTPEQYLAGLNVITGPSAKVLGAAKPAPKMKPRNRPSFDDAIDFMLEFSPGSFEFQEGLSMIMDQIYNTIPVKDLDTYFINLYSTAENNGRTVKDFFCYTTIDVEIPPEILATESSPERTKYINGQVELYTQMYKTPLPKPNKLGAILIFIPYRIQRLEGQLQIAGRVRAMEYIPGTRRRKAFINGPKKAPDDFLELLKSNPNIQALELAAAEAKFKFTPKNDKEVAEEDEGPI